MRKSKVAIVDYGVGNLFSVRRALEFCGATDVVLASSADEILEAERLILPGVGAFQDGMKGLDERKLVEPIQCYAQSGRPLMGICLGMQMLATVSEEFGLHEGLNLIPGRVTAIPARRDDSALRKIPFIGWAGLNYRAETDGNSMLSQACGDGSVYLVHSYHMEPDDPAHRLATYDYEGFCVTAAVQRNNIIGLQFHPEKSGQVGMKILTAFLHDGMETTGKHG